jgi:putative ABC transport system permease protein
MKIKDIGIRKVNGAKVREIILMLFREVFKWIGLAMILGTPMAYIAIDRWLQNFAYRTVISYWVFLVSAAIALFITLITISWQSWRAATRNPVEALRYE